MTDDTFEEIIKEIRNEIVAGDHSFIEERFGSKYWNIGDVLWFLAVNKLIQDQVPDRDLIKNFNNAYGYFCSIFKEGITTGKLVPIKNMELRPAKPKFLSTFSLSYNLRNYYSYVSEKIELLNPNIKLRKQFVFSYEGLRFIEGKGISFPKKISTTREKNSMKVTPQDADNSLIEVIEILNRMGGHVETEAQSSEHESLIGGSEGERIQSPVNKEELIRQIRKEAGEKKGEKWREFITNNIKPVVERELKQGCLCLHRDLAARLREELLIEAKRNLDPKSYHKIQNRLHEKIEEGIIQVFYDFGQEFGNVRSRVFRGKYYGEYDHTSCHHSGK